LTRPPAPGWLGKPVELLLDGFEEGGLVDFGEREVQVGAFIHDPVDEEAEVGVGAEGSSFHGVFFFVYVFVCSCRRVVAPASTNSRVFQASEDNRVTDD
jgi:hypothetical protein